MALSDTHLARHVVEIQERFLSAGDYGGGGHSGVSLNVYCGILGEKPKRLAPFMANLKVADIPEPLKTELKKRTTDPYGTSLASLYFRPAT